MVKELLLATSERGRVLLIFAVAKEMQIFGSGGGRSADNLTLRTLAEESSKSNSKRSTGGCYTKNCRFEDSSFFFCATIRLISRPNQSIMFGVGIGRR